MSRKSLIVFLCKIRSFYRRADLAQASSAGTSDRRTDRQILRRLSVLWQDETERRSLADHFLCVTMWITRPANETSPTVGEAQEFLFHRAGANREDCAIRRRTM